MIKIVREPRGAVWWILLVNNDDDSSHNAIYYERTCSQPKYHHNRHLHPEVCFCKRVCTSFASWKLRICIIWELCARICYGLYVFWFCNLKLSFNIFHPQVNFLSWFLFVRNIQVHFCSFGIFLRWINKSAVLLQNLFLYFSSTEYLNRHIYN